MFAAIAGKARISGSVPTPELNRASRKTPVSWRNLQAMIGNALPRLYCFPYAGGGAAVFHRCFAGLKDRFEVEPIRLPGRDALLGEPPLESVEAMAERALKQIGAGRKLGSAPMLLLGYSLGGLVAFETARRLGAQPSALPAALVVVSCRPPQSTVAAEPIHRLEDAHFLQALRGRFGHTAGLPDHPDLLRLLLPTLRADVCAVESYWCDPDERLTVPLLAMGGAQDPWLTLSELERWRQYTSGMVLSRQFPGGHFFLESSSETVARAIQGLWERIARGPC